MSTYRMAGHGQVPADDMPRGLVAMLARALGAASAPPAALTADRLSGASFLDQEPALAKEAHDHIRSL